MPDAPDLCARLGAWIATPRVLPQPVQDKARIILADALTLALASRDSPSARVGTAMVGSVPGPVTLWCNGRGCAVMDAVLLNALLAHERFQDDCEMVSWTHPGSFVVPAAVAGAESHGAALGDVLLGVAIGYALVAWMGAQEHIAHALMGRGFRCSPTLGPIAAAAAFAGAAGLDARATGSALAAAALQGRGTLQAVAGGGDDWRWQNATAARDGVTLAMAARHGLRAAAEALEGPRGFLRTYCGQERVPERWTLMPEIADLLNVWHKPFPTLGDNQAPALAACMAFERIADPGAIERVDLRMATRFVEFPGTQRRPPFATPIQAIASVRFAVALGLLHGRLERESFDSFSDGAVVAMTQRIHVTADDSLTYTEADLDVKLRDGGVVRIARGDLPRNAFFRDHATARSAAALLLGTGGIAAVDRLFAAEPGESASHVIRAALTHAV